VNPLYRTNHLSILAAAAIAAVLLATAAHAWREEDFEHRTVVAYPIPPGRDNIIGRNMRYKIKKGDTLLDVGRWFDLTATEISDANRNIDWWAPPVGREVVLPGEFILPDSSRKGLVLNIPEMRIYYFPVKLNPKRKPGKLTLASYTEPDTVYTFPVGLGRFDWKTPEGAFKIQAKIRNPTWHVPKAIYEEHLERDGYADHVVKANDPDNPLGEFKIALTLPDYAIHGTNVPWGVGMQVSHGCVRLYPEDIEALFDRVKVGSPGEFVYQPVKFGWKGDALYVEVHPDLYAKAPGLWNLAIKEAERAGVADQVDARKLEKAIVAKTGMPTYVMPGRDPVEPEIEVF
jgi:L,D-transpeptidase ErfK/SrfK